jgi:hypothetical protein
MKTFGLTDTQELVSIVLDDDGNPRLDTLKPADAGEDWAPPRLVPLVKLLQPAHDEATQTCEPLLVWHDDRVERDWTIRDLTPEEIAARNRKVWPNAQAFLTEFTFPEMAAISLSADPTIAALRLLLSAWAGEVYSDDERVQTGLDALVSLGIISNERRAEILA